jgi:hypothetical protein
MGIRGPLRNPNSRRGRAEIRRIQKLAENPPAPVKHPQPAPENPPVTPENLPTPPECFNREQKKLFQNLVVDLLAAKVPLRRVDGHAIAQAVRCIAAIEEAEEIGNSGEANFDQRLAALRLKYQYGASLKDWLDRICATVPSRARAVGKEVPEKKPGPLAQLLAGRQARRGN